MPLTLVARLHEAFPDTIVGMKDSSGDVDNMIGAAKNFPGFAVFSGSDELLLASIEAGGAGCITACANVASRLAAEVYGGWVRGEDVGAANEMLTAVRNTIMKFPLSTALKTLMARHSGNDGWLNIRPPLTRMSDTDRDTLFGTFDAIGFEVPLAA